MLSIKTDRLEINQVNNLQCKINVIVLEFLLWFKIELVLVRLWLLNFKDINPLSDIELLDINTLV